MPANENVWKIVCAYAGNDIPTRDKLALRLVSRDMHNVVSPYIQFSQAAFCRFADEFHKHAQNYNTLDKWLHLEDQLKTQIHLNKTDPAFCEAVAVWLAAFYNVGSHAEVPQHVKPILERESVKRQREAQQYRPSFRRGIKKVASGVGAIIAAALTVVSVPLAVVAVPFILNSGSRTGGVGVVLVLPLLGAAQLTYWFGQKVAEPNLRMATEYANRREICECIERIKEMLKL